MVQRGGWVLRIWKPKVVGSNPTAFIISLFFSFFPFLFNFILFILFLFLYIFLFSLNHFYVSKLEHRKMHKTMKMPFIILHI